MEGIHSFLQKKPNDWIRGRYCDHSKEVRCRQRANWSKIWSCLASPLPDVSSLPLSQRGWEGQLSLCPHPFSRCEFPPGLLLKSGFMDRFIGEEGVWGGTVTGDLLEMQPPRPRPRPAESESAFPQHRQGSCRHVKV